MKAFFDVLLFPNALHERGPDPGPFTDYRQYKSYLRREFKRKCVYCRISDGLKGEEGFGVDHYLPKSKFPHLDAAWSNLFYVCNVCNSRKGDTVSGPERFLPNPCDHRLADHLQYRGAEVDTFTKHGEWLAELLQLGERRSIREFVLSALKVFLEIRNELIGQLAEYEARLEKRRNKKTQSAIRTTSEELKEIERDIERLTGESIQEILEAQSP